MTRGPETAPDVGRRRATTSSTLLYTSGTTGRPKGVLFTHGRTGTSGPHFIEALGLVPDDVILAVTPLFHGNAWGAVVTALHAGATVAFPKAFHASEFWPLVHETRRDGALHARARSSRCCSRASRRRSSARTGCA